MQPLEIFEERGNPAKECPMKKSVLASFAFAVLVTAQTSQATEITLDISHYLYEETTDSGAFFMKDESDPLFISAGVRDWESPKELGALWYMYTGEVTYGKVEYTGSGTSQSDYYKARMEGYLSYRLNKRITPFVGLGYRWLWDDAGGTVTSTGALGYDRQSQYLYAPIGATFNVSDKFSIKGQYNYFIQGKQTSYLSTASSLYSDIENDQNSGWGVDFTATQKWNDRFGIFLFYRHWDIDKSEVSTGTYSNIATFTAWEPANTTSEAGIGVSYKF